MSAFATIRRPATFSVAIAATVGLAACGGGRERPQADMAAAQVTTIGVNSYLWRAALDALAATGRIGESDARRLGDSYDGLRTIEHRLQMVGDQQTHSLPSGQALDEVARLHGLDTGAQLVEAVETLARPVAERFDALLDEGQALRGRSPVHRSRHGVDLIADAGRGALATALGLVGLECREVVADGPGLDLLRV